MFPHYIVINPSAQIVIFKLKLSKMNYTCFTILGDDIEATWIINDFAPKL